MTEHVLLTDNDDGAALVACADRQEAEALGAAAIFSDGGVSAWLLPKRAMVVDHDALRERLRDGDGVHDLYDWTDGEDAYAEVAVVSTRELEALVKAARTLVDDEFGFIHPDDASDEVRDLHAALVPFEPKEN